MGDDEEVTVEHVCNLLYNALNDVMHLAARDHTHGAKWDAAVEKEQHACAMYQKLVDKMGHVP